MKLSRLRKFRGFKAGIRVDDKTARVISPLVPEQFLDRGELFD